MEFNSPLEAMLSECIDVVVGRCRRQVQCTQQSQGREENRKKIKKVFKGAIERERHNKRQKMLAFIKDGRTNKEIADVVGVHIGTVARARKKHNLFGENEHGKLQGYRR